MQNNYFGWAWYEATYFCVDLINSKWQVKGKFGHVVCRLSQTRLEISLLEDFRDSTYYNATSEWRPNFFRWARKWNLEMGREHKINQSADESMKDPRFQGELAGRRTGTVFSLWSFTSLITPFLNDGDLNTDICKALAHLKNKFLL